MRFLLDTHALLWWLFDDPKLPPSSRVLIMDSTNTILVSSASAWEVCTKFRLGKLPAAEQLVDDFATWIRKAEFTELAVTLDHARLAGQWSQPHRDPFDRMLAAQSRIENVPLISKDPIFEAFDIEQIW